MIEEGIESNVPGVYATSRLNKLNFEMYSQILNQTEEDIREQMSDDANKRVRSRLVLEKIAEVEEMKVEENDIEDEYKKISEMYGLEVDQLKQIISPEQLSYDILIRKAVELVQESRV